MGLRVCKSVGYAVRFLLALWLLPLTLLALPAYAIMLALGLLCFDGMAAPWCIRFKVIERNAWWKRRWWGWAGLALPHAILLTDRASAEHEAHELRHVDQWLLLGPLFPLVYGVLLLWYGYLNHPFEKDAKAAAIKSRVRS